MHLEIYAQLGKEGVEHNDDEEGASLEGLFG